MKLTEWPTRKQVGRPSAVDLLPDEVRDQLVAARLGGTHSVGAMVAWLKAEGHDQVSSNALANWFQTRGHQSGGAREA
jgi:hypothetical protein